MVTGIDAFRSPADAFGACRALIHIGIEKGTARLPLPSLFSIERDPREGDRADQSLTRSTMAPQRVSFSSSRSKPRSRW